jgi:hypothetical protein
MWLLARMQWVSWNPVKSLSNPTPFPKLQGILRINTPLVPVL